MTEYATSADGTRIAYDRDGSGPTVILIGGAMQFRGFDPLTVELARALAAESFTVINYDRRGRGESPAQSFGLDRELEDLAALIDVAGGSAALYGSSSGGAIALAAAAGGAAVTKLALWEVPLDKELGSGGAEFLAGLRERIRTGDGDATIEYFMKDMPPEWLEGSRQSPGWPIMTAMGPSLEGDCEALAWTQTAPHRELWSRITQPTIALVGEQTLPLMPPAAEAIATALRDARVVTVPGAANHSWDVGAMTAVLAGFLRS